MVLAVNNSRTGRRKDTSGADGVPQYLSGLTRLAPDNLEIMEKNPNKFAVKVSGGIFAGEVHIRKTGRYLFISDGGETSKAVSEEFLTVLFEESTDDSLLMEDYVREILVNKGIQVTHTGIFQIVVPIPAEHEYGALVGACFALDEGTAFVKRMAGCFANNGKLQA